jgi:predicted PhzF superfamily epimerase YddE/YHI9
MPSWHHKQLGNAAAVEEIKLVDTVDMEHTMVWAWIDEAKGLIRARTFAKDWDIPEAEGNGSGSIMLAAIINREIKIKHGKGSIIFAKPASNNFADIGGYIIEDKTILLQ